MAENEKQAVPRHSFTVLLENDAAYRNGLLALSTLASIEDVPNLVPILRVDECCQTATPSIGGHLITITEEKVFGVSLEEVTRLCHRRLVRRLNAEALALISHDILTAVRSLHQEHCTIHGAVNLQTVLLDSHGSRARLRTSLYSQVCLSGKTARLSPFLSHTFRLLSEEGCRDPSAVLYWCAPEVFSAGYVDLAQQMVITRSFASDIFSLGVTLLYLVLPVEKASSSPSENRDSSDAVSRRDCVVSCVQALQTAESSDARVDKGESVVAELTTVFGEEFVEFLRASVNLSSEKRHTAAQLLESAFIRVHLSTEREPHAECLRALMEEVEHSLGDPGLDTGHHTPRTANTPQQWAASPVRVVNTVGERVAKGQKSGNGTQDWDERTSPLPEFTLPEDLLRVVVSPFGDDESTAEGSESPLPKFVVREATNVSTSTPRLEGNDEDAAREGCETSLFEALRQTQLIMKETHRAEERRQAALEVRRFHSTGKRQPNASFPQTPFSPQGIDVLSSANITAGSTLGRYGSTGWPQHFGATPQSESVSPRQGTTLLAFAGPGSPASSQHQEGAVWSPEEDQKAAQKAENINSLLQRMINEVSALQVIAPNFASRFCEELASGAERDPQTVARCAASVQSLLPPIAPQNGDSASATASTVRQGALLRELQRNNARINYAKPLRTADEWAQALSMPQENRTLPRGARDGGAGLLDGVGGAAAPLLYNRWLKQQQKKAARS